MLQPGLCKQEVICQHVCRAERAMASLNSCPFKAGPEQTLLPQASVAILVNSWATFICGDPETHLLL